jgi:AraC-like DNA-binding protein
VFKKEVGVSPLQYQKEILKLNSETMLASQPAKIRY